MRIMCEIVYYNGLKVRYAINALSRNDELDCSLDADEYQPLTDHKLYLYENLVMLFRFKTCTVRLPCNGHKTISGYDAIENSRTCLKQE